MERNRSVLPVAIGAGVIALILGMCIGLFIGGTGGYVLGRQSSGRSPQNVPQNWEWATPPSPQQESPEGIPPFDQSGSGGALVQEVVPGSPAGDAGLQRGDVIIGVDFVPVDANHSLTDVLAQYAPGDTVRITYVRGDRQETARVQLGENPQDERRAYLGIVYGQVNTEEEQQP